MAALLLIPVGFPAHGRDQPQEPPGRAEQSGGAGPASLHERPDEKDGYSWIFTTLGSYSWLSEDSPAPRPDWIESSTELLFRATPTLVAGGRVQTRERQNETDLLYSVLVSQWPTRSLEWHAAVTASPDPSFSAEEAYTLDLGWRATSLLSALLGYSRLEFATGSIDLFESGAMLWFAEQTSLTGSYAYGRAFAGTDFEYYVLRLDLGLAGDSRLTFAATRGTDPEKEPDTPVTLTSADSISAYGHIPILRNTALILGVEYEDRERTDTGADVYMRTTASLGITVRF